MPQVLPLSKKRVRESRSWFISRRGKGSLLFMVYLPVVHTNRARNRFRSIRVNQICRESSRLNLLLRPGSRYSANNVVLLSHYQRDEDKCLLESVAWTRGSLNTAFVQAAFVSFRLSLCCCSWMAIRDGDNSIHILRFIRFNTHTHARARHNNTIITERFKLYLFNIYLYLLPSIT